MTRAFARVRLSSTLCRLGRRMLFPHLTFAPVRTVLTALAAGSFLFGSSPLVGAALPMEQVTAPNLGTASTFGVLGGSGVTIAAGSTTVTGNLGVYSGTSITGQTNLTLVNGAVHQTDAVAQQAQADTTAAYIDLGQRTCTQTFSAATTELSTLPGQPLVPGVYCFSAIATLTGVLTLSG